MSISQKWDDIIENLYLVTVGGTDWQWQELTDTVKQVYKMLGTTDKEVHFAIWFQGKLPQGNILAHMRVIGGDQPPNLRHTVFINHSGKFLEMLIQSFDRANNWEGPGFVDSLEEARAYLADKGV